LYTVYRCIHNHSPRNFYVPRYNQCDKYKLLGLPAQVETSHSVYINGQFATTKQI